MDCPWCLEETPMERICVRCGKDLTESCPACGKRHVFGTIFCPRTRKDITIIKAGREKADSSLNSILESPGRTIGIYEGVGGLLGAIVGGLLLWWFYPLIWRFSTPSHAGDPVGAFFGSLVISILLAVAAGGICYSLSFSYAKRRYWREIAESYYAKKSRVVETADR
jgi:hypothetical protein